MLKGFKEFLLKGNVIDLATAVVIGAAFGAVITAFTDNVVKPLINSLGGGESGKLGFYIKEGIQETFVDFGAIITAAINFVVIAAVVYFVLVMPYEKFKAARKASGEAEATETDILVEIRDLLASAAPQVAPQTFQTPPAAGDYGQKTW